MSPRRSPSRSTRIRPLSVTAPMAVPPTSHFSQTASASSSLPGSTTQSMRSWDSLTITSKGSMPGSRSGTLATSMSMPTPPLAAISAAEEVSPAAPRSCSEVRSSRSSSSRQHSSSFFSVNGSPICTEGRLASSPSPSSALARTDAPPIPSRPVSAPSRTRTLPGPAAALRIRRSWGAIPRHMALTRQFCS